MSEGAITHREQAHDFLHSQLDRGSRVERYVVFLKLKSSFDADGESTRAEVLLICPTAHRDALTHHINSDPSSSSISSIRIDIQTFDQAQDNPAGTARILAHFATRIAGDFVLLPCDFLPPPSLRLETVLNKFRVESSSEGSIATALFYETRGRHSEGEKAPSKSTPSGEEAWSAPPPPAAIIYEPKEGTLLHVDALDDQDRDGDEMALRMATLWQHPRVSLSTRLADAHVYVCRRAVLDLLQLKQKDTDSFREEFFPWLCKLQTHRARRRKYMALLKESNAFSALAQSQSHDLALQHSTSQKPSLSHLSSPHIGSADSSPETSAPGSDSSTQSLRVGLVIHPHASGHAARANTVHTYLELNRLTLGSRVSERDPSLIDPKANISADCLIGSSTRVGERTTIKKCMVGSHCVIGKNVKLSGCVLMEYCVVEDGVKLDGCILGKNTRVGPKAELTKCLTQAGFEVEAGGTFKHEKLEVSDWMTGAVEEESDEDDSEEDIDSGSNEED